MNRERKPARFSLRDAVARLQSVVSLEEFSSLTGTSALVIDFEADRSVEPTACERAMERLRVIPCPTIGVSASAAPTDAPIAKRLDVIVSEEQLERVADAVVHRPIASMALVQLLRHSEGLDVHEALVAESLVYSTLQSGPEFREWLSRRKRVVSESASTEPAVLVSRAGAKLELVLNRPERHNAYSAEMRDALVAAFELAVADTSVEEIVLRGRGPSFSAGGDLAEFGTLPDPATAHAIRSTRNAARLLARCSDRVRVEVHGACIGAGVELPAFAARVVARKDAFFQLPEVGMGLVPGAGGTASIPRRIGRQRTAYLALTGERIDARTALAWGLVDDLVD